MIIHEAAQNSVEWLLARAGVPSASQFHRVITPTTLKPSASSGAYMYDLLTECLLGGPLETQSNDFMQRGHELEDEAVLFFEGLTDLDTKQVGFCMTDDGKMGCSPDRLVGSKSGLEVKCPSAPVHVMYKHMGILPTKFRAQVQGSMYVTELDEWHFLSYNPILDPLHIVVERDPKFMERFEEIMGEFLLKFEKTKIELGIAA